MLRYILTGLPVLVLCLVLEAVFVAMCVRFYARHELAHRHASLVRDVVVLSILMLTALGCNFVQLTVWATLFVALGEFGDFSTALYYSGVNFSTLGYGDLVLSERWRLLGPLEAANGILMFGVSTAVMTAAVTNVIKHRADRHEQGA
jgi:hypothetical protein